MGRARAFLRLAALVVVTLPAYLGLLAGKPLVFLSASLAARYANFWIRGWARVSSRVLGLRIHAEGPLPEPPFFLVANHLSYLDILVLHSLVRARFLSKSEVAHWPVLGILARTAGTLFIERDRRRDLKRVIAEVRRVLENGGGVVVFPEGTSTRGEAVNPFKPSIFEVAIQAGVPVSCAALHYGTPPGTPPADTAVCWWGDMTFGGHFLSLLTLPSIDARVAFGDAPLTAGDRKSLARRAQRAVEERFIPVVGCEA